MHACGGGRASWLGSASVRCLRPSRGPSSRNCLKIAGEAGVATAARVSMVDTRSIYKTLRPAARLGQRFESERAPERVDEADAEHHDVVGARAVRVARLARAR